MGLPEISNKNIAQYLNKDTIVQQTAEQIMKDFSMFGVTITYSGNTKNAYNELLSQVKSEISTLFSNDYGRLLSLLYQIDISDKELSKTHEELTNYTPLEVIAHQIIVRELKKVLTREYFKSKY